MPQLVRLGSLMNSAVSGVGGIISGVTGYFTNDGVTDAYYSDDSLADKYQSED